MTSKKDNYLKLVLSGLEHLPNSVSQDDCVVFGDWVSQIKRNDSKGRVNLFPFDFNVEEIQSREDILNQDEQVRALYSDLLPLMAEKLNKLHAENYTIRQWEIIVGFWLRHFLDALMVRWVLVSAALKLDFSHVYLIDTSKKSLCPQPKSRDEFAILCNSSGKVGLRWNQFIVSKIASVILANRDISANTKIEIVRFSIDQPKKYYKKSLFFNKVKKSVKIFSKFVIEGISRKFPSRILMYSPNLNVLEMLVLSIKLRKFPFIYFLRDSSSIERGYYSNSSILSNNREISIAHNPEKNDDELREIFDEPQKYKCPFSNLVMELLSQSIPRCYIEDWASYNQALNRLNLPKTLDHIYVGSGIITDELLRLYVAKMVSKHCDFIISQHGGVYGFSLIQEKTEFVEQRISDKWISWGWTSNNRKNVVPGPALKGQVKLKLSSERESLFIALPPIRFSPSRLNYSDPYEIVESHIKFIRSLDPRISNNVIIRPAPNHRNFQYVIDLEKQFKVSKTGSFNDDLSKSKLFLCTHNATTMLEALFSNFPTIILLPKYKYYTQHYVREEAWPMIQELKEVGIYFDDPEAAKKQIQTVWSDVDGWWRSKEIQEVLNKFCQIYCRKSNNYLNSLATIINRK